MKFTKQQEIEQWLNQFNINNYTINDDLTVDIDGNVALNYKDLDSIPIQFGLVKGSFDCSGNNFTSLKGCPTKVTGAFHCNSNQLVSLQYCPTEIGRSFYCNNNAIANLDFMPNVGEHISFENNQLKNLKGLPSIIYGGLGIIDNPIESLDYFPVFLQYSFWASQNVLELILNDKSYILNQTDFQSNLVFRMNDNQKLSDRPELDNYYKQNGGLTLDLTPFELKSILLYKKLEDTLPTKDTIKKTFKV